MEYPNVLRHILYSRGITQADLARDIGTSPNVISNYCRGSRAPSLWNAYRIAELLGMDVLEIWWYGANPDEITECEKQLPIPVRSKGGAARLEKAS